jgi:putative transposase
MARPSEKTFYNQQKGPRVIDEDKFRFEMFVLLIEEWLRRKLKIWQIVEF